jgi:hypothetical protein
MPKAAEKLKVLQTETSAEIRTLSGTIANTILSLTFSPNGRQVARFLNNTAAVTRYTEMLNFITGRGNVTRAEKVNKTQAIAVGRDGMYSFGGTLTRLSPELQKKLGMKNKEKNR